MIAQKRNGLKPLPTLAILLAMLSVSLLFGFPPVRAASFVPAPPVTVVTNSGHQELTVWSASCTVQGFYYSFFIDSTATPTVFGLVSSDGVNWPASPTSVQVLSNSPNTGFSLVGQVAMSCTNTGASGQLAIAWTDNAAGAGKWHIDWTLCSLSGGVISPCAAFTQGPLSTNSHLINLATGSGVFSIRQLSQTTYYGVNNNGVGREIVVNNVEQLNTSMASGFDFGVGLSGNQKIAVAAGPSDSTHLQYGFSTDGLTWSCCTSIATLNGGQVTFGSAITGSNSLAGASSVLGIGANVWITYMEAHSGGACTTAICMEEAQVNIAGSLSRTIIGDASGGGSNPLLLTSDGGNNIIVVDHPGSNTAGVIAQSTDGGTTWAFSTFTGQGSIGSGTTIYQEMLSGIYSTLTNSFMITSASSAAPFNVFVQVFTLGGASVSGTSTIGSCPVKNTATTTLTNNTAFLWGSLAFGGAGEIIQNIQTQVASSNVGHVTSETVILAVYQMAASAYTGTAWPVLGINNPYVLIAQKSFTFAPGNYQGAAGAVNWAANIGFVAPGQPYAIALLGNSKIAINNSALAGMTTATAPGGVMPATISTTATTATELFFCGTLTFATVITTTLTTTKTVTTSTSGGTTTVTTTASGDITQFGQASTNYAILFLLLAGPAILFAGVFGAFTKSGTGAMAGGAVGLGMGAAIANIAQLIPIWIVGVMVLFIVFLIILAVRGGNNG